jgi:hypothetical protein
MKLRTVLLNEKLMFWLAVIARLASVCNKVCEFWFGFNN